MGESKVDVVVIGAGQAGLAVSYYLQQQGLRHVVLERRRIGESWRSQRWDSFVLNSPNKFNLLPGDTYEGSNPDGFGTAHNFVTYLERYASKLHLPVHEDACVLSLERKAESFVAMVQQHGTTAQYASRQVVIASGGMNAKKIPSCASGIPPRVQQYHAGEYRNPSQLPEGAVLVVGSAQSGLQVAEDLLEAGRKVFLSTSAVARVPRRYRGKDILEWLLLTGFYDVRTEDVTDPKELEMRPPQVSGVGPLGHTHSLQWLARRGVVILGRLERVEGAVFHLQPNAAFNVKFADEISGRVKRLIEDYIARNELHVPPPEPDPADEPDADAACASSITTLNLEEHGIRSIVWTTGFSPDYSYLKLPVFDPNGKPKHRRGVTEVPGVYFVGLPWLSKRKSGIICGIDEDARMVVEMITRTSGNG